MKQLDLFEELNVVKTSVQQQWNITYNNTTLTQFDMDKLMLAASRGRGDWEKYIQSETIGVCRAAPDGVHIIVDPPKISEA